MEYTLLNIYICYSHYYDFIVPTIPLFIFPSYKNFHIKNSIVDLL